MTGEGIAELLAVGILVVAFIFHLKRPKQNKQIQINTGEGSMAKAVKVTMGICFGLVLFGLLMGFGYIALLGGFSTH